VDATTQKELRARLEEERADLIQQLEDMGMSPETGAPDEATFEQGFADSGQATADKASTLSLARSLLEILHEINDAFDRMDKGTYGKCVSCGADIAPERLEVRPYARECMSCKQRG
jgi:RNA polymerase-binding transcription factor DksA